MENQTRIIKRYSNRKLYDTLGSCYVTLQELFQIIREGSNIEVIEKKTNMDITYRTLMQVLHEKEKRPEANGDIHFLNKIIRSKEGTFTGYIKELEEELHGPKEEAPLQAHPANNFGAEETGVIQ